MSRINTNIAALRVVNRLMHNQADLNLRLERLSTGLRINRGRDEPAGLIVSELLRSEIRATRQAISNSTRANNVVSTAEGALNEVSALLLDLQELVVSSANEAGLSGDEIRANQLAIDSILDSIDRIGQTTQFGTEKLLDGSKAYQLSAVPPAAIGSISVFSAKLAPNTTRDITVRVTQSARPAQVSFIGTTVGGVSTTSAATLQIQGTLGSQLFTFASGTNLADIRNAINQITPATGVFAVTSSPAVGAAASALVLSSTTLGADAFVSVTPISGQFITSGNNNTAIRGNGVEAAVLVDGQPAVVSGLRADVRAGGLDAMFFLTQVFAQTLSSATFSLAGGGGIFQLAPEISPNGQLFVGLDRLSTTDLGDAVTGRLYTLRSGAGNHLASKNFETAQNILEQAVTQVASSRGRLGTLQRDHLDPNIRSQNVVLENVTASESSIRDADIAVEVSALTRAQILVQSTQNVLRIANSVPNSVLSLLA